MFFHLIECDDADFEACVLPDDFLSVCVCVEWVHENEGDVRIEGLVKVLDLLNRQVQETEVRPNLDGRTHVWSQTANYVNLNFKAKNDNKNIALKKTVIQA